jgi:hypothetical protein
MPRTGCRRGALCLALAGDFDTAALAAEQTLAGAAPGASRDPWLLAAVETMRTPARTRPGGRYATPIETAVSVSAGLGAARGALDALPPDLALAVIRHPTSTPDQKRAALAPLLAAGRLSPEDLSLVVDEAGAARPPPGASPSAVLLAQALVNGRTQGVSDGGRAAAYAAALKSAATADEFQLAAMRLAPMIRALPRTPETAVQAETLARGRDRPPRPRARHALARAAQRRGLRPLGARAP